MIIISSFSHVISHHIISSRVGYPSQNVAHHMTPNVPMCHTYPSDNPTLKFTCPMNNHKSHRVYIHISKHFLKANMLDLKNR